MINISAACRFLQDQQVSVHFFWVPSHQNIFGNEMADRLAKAGLRRKSCTSLFTSYSFLKRSIRANTLQDWEQVWTANAIKQGKHYTTICRNQIIFSLQSPREKFPKKTQAAFFQLKFGKGFFKSHSKTIGKSDSSKCFGICIEKQTPTHLILGCRHYKKERKVLQKTLKSRLTITKLFCTKKGREALFHYLDHTGIATQAWMLQKDC